MRFVVSPQVANKTTVTSVLMNPLYMSSDRILIVGYSFFLSPGVAKSHMLNCSTQPSRLTLMWSPRSNRVSHWEKSNPQLHEHPRNNSSTTFTSAATIRSKDNTNGRSTTSVAPRRKSARLQDRLHKSSPRRLPGVYLLCR